MQKVNLSGRLGEVQDFDLFGLEKSIADPEVDYVRVFNRGKGCQMQVEKNELKALITEAVDEALERRSVLRAYDVLTRPRQE